MRARLVGAECFMDREVYAQNNIISTGQTIYSYGSHFPMATHLDSGRIWVNSEKYSMTTSGHQSALRTVLTANGYCPTTDSFDYQGHAGTAWAQTGWADEAPGIDI